MIVGRIWSRRSYCWGTYTLWMIILGPEKSSASLGFPHCISCWQKSPSLYLSQGMTFIYSGSPLCKNPSWLLCQVCYHLCRVGIGNNMKLEFPESVLPKKLTDRGVLHSLLEVGTLHLVRWTHRGPQKRESLGCWELLKREISNLLTLVGRNSRVTMWVISCIFQTVPASLAKILSSEE